MSPNLVLMLRAFDKPIAEGKVILTASTLPHSDICRTMGPGWLEIDTGKQIPCERDHVLAAATWETWVSIYELPAQGREAVSYSRIHIKLPEKT